MFHYWADAVPVPVTWECTHYVCTASISQEGMYLKWADCSDSNNSAGNTSEQVFQISITQQGIFCTECISKLFDSSVGKIQVQEDKLGALDANRIDLLNELFFLFPYE